MRTSRWVAISLLWALACSSESSPENPPSTGTGGTAHAATGGAPPATGGQLATPQAGMAQGGSPNATGGAAGRGSGVNGGAPATGGVAVGGAATGGATGGAATAGGAGNPGAGGGGAGGTGGASGCPVIAEFEDWPPGKAPADVGPLLVGDYLGRTEAGGYHYADACAWYGALQFTKLTGDNARNLQLVTKFDPYLNGTNYFPNGMSVDDHVGGIVPFELGIQTGEQKYTTNGLIAADRLFMQYDPDLRSARFWIDDMFMITALFAQATRASKDVKYRDLAARIMLEYQKALQQENGLFHHTRESKVHWGRGNGWVAVGMSELLLDLPTSDTRDQISANYKSMMAALKMYQIPEGQTDAGLWRQIINDDTAWAETSATAMFTFAIATGVRQGWLDAAEYAPVARRGWLALVGQINGQGKLQNICEGTGMPLAGADAAAQRQFYLDRKRGTGDLHGQAPVLWSATTLLRNYKCMGPEAPL